MKKILIATLALGFVAGPVAAATMPFPEKAEAQSSFVLKTPNR